MFSRHNKIRAGLATGAVATLAAVTVPVLAATPAVALEKKGSCDQGKAKYEFEVDKEHGRYEVDFELKAATAGQKWRVKLAQNGTVFYNKVRTTDRDREIEVERNRPNTKGPDVFKATATNLSTGAVCTVTIKRVEKRGQCDAGKARYQFEVNKERSRYEVDFGLKASKVGQKWRVKLSQNGKVFYNKVHTTDRYGWIDVERMRPNTTGADVFRANATNLANGAVCKVAVKRK